MYNIRLIRSQRKSVKTVMTAHDDRPRCEMTVAHRRNNNDNDKTININVYHRRHIITRRRGLSSPSTGHRVRKFITPFTGRFGQRIRTPIKYRFDTAAVLQCVWP